MAVPQPGVFALGTRSHWYLELDVFDHADPAAVGDAVRAVAGAAQPAAGVNVVVGFGGAWWRRLCPQAVPAGLAPFDAVDGVDGHRIPATQHDLWVWVHGPGDDSVFDTARAAVAALRDSAEVATEQQGFTYHDSRDLTGFIDGTENPTVDEAVAVACVDDGASGAGGSFVLVQRWVHDLDGFADLTVSEQERVVGRTKADSVELDDAVRPPDSHVSRMELDPVDGEDLELWRRSTPWGGIGEAGLVFVAFSAEPDRFLRMLRRMVGAEDGLRDRLTDFSAADRSAVYFVPSVDDLAAAGT